MRTKIVLCALIALLSSSVLLAQSKTTFGLRGGVNFFALNTKDAAGDKSDSKLVTGFNIGVNAEIPVGVDFYLQPGLLFITKGGEDIATDGKIIISYLEIPVNFLYKPSLGAGRLILGFGPYFAFGVNAKAKLNGETIDLEFTNELEPSDPPGLYLKRFDAGANFLFGYEWSNRFSVQLNASLGLTNFAVTDPDLENDASSIKNTGFGVSLGYRFGK